MINLPPKGAAGFPAALFYVLQERRSRIRRTGFCVKKYSLPGKKQGFLVAIWQKACGKHEKRRKLHKKSIAFPKIRGYNCVINMNEL